MVARGFTVLTCAITASTLEKLVADFRRALFGARSEKTDPEHFELALEDIETAMAVVHAEDAALDPPASRATKPRNTNRGSLPKHLPCIEEVIEPEQTLCGCGAERHVNRPGFVGDHQLK